MCRSALRQANTKEYMVIAQKYDITDRHSKNLVFKFLLVRGKSTLLSDNILDLVQRSDKDTNVNE